MSLMVVTIDPLASKHLTITPPMLIATLGHEPNILDASGWLIATRSSEPMQPPSDV